MYSSGDVSFNLLSKPLNRVACFYLLFSILKLTYICAAKTPTIMTSKELIALEDKYGAYNYTFTCSTF